MLRRLELALRPRSRRPHLTQSGTKPNPHTAAGQLDGVSLTARPEPALLRVAGKTTQNRPTIAYLDGKIARPSLHVLHQSDQLPAKQMPCGGKADTGALARRVVIVMTLPRRASAKVRSMLSHTTFQLMIFLRLPLSVHSWPKADWPLPGRRQGKQALYKRNSDTAKGAEKRGPGAGVTTDQGC